MYVLNAQLKSPSTDELAEIFAKIDVLYNVFFVPMMLGLIVGYISLLIAIVKGQTVFSKKALFFFPLLVAVLISLLDSAIDQYPILLKKAA